MKTAIYGNSKIKRNKTVEGETIERMLARAQENKEPIGHEVPTIYTDKNIGVHVAYNIRTDRFEVALDGFNSIEKSALAKRESKAQMEVVNDEKKEVSGTDSQGE